MQRSFPYSKGAFAVNMVFLLVVIVGTLAVLLLTWIDLASLIIIMVLELALLVVLGFSPFFTEHEISEGELILRQGWYFRASIPIAEIRVVKRVAKGPSRTGVYFRVLSSTLFVTSRRYDLVEVELRRKMTFGLALGKRADHIIFDAVDVPFLVRSLESSRSLSPVEADRP